MLPSDQLKYNGPYQFSNEGAYAAFYSAPTHEPKNDVLELMSNSVYGCRDGMSKALRDCIIGGSIETDKNRHIFVWHHPNMHEKSVRKDHEKWAERGVAVMHAMEKLAGWPLTRPRVVKMPKNHQFGLYCRSSRRWLKTPYYVTLYILLMRMCGDPRITGFKTFNELEILMTKLSKTGGFKRDDNHVRGTYMYWRAMMVGYPEIFEKKKITHYWNTDRLNAGSNGYGEGVLKFCSGGTSYKKARERMLKVKEELDKKKK